MVCRSLCHYGLLLVCLRGDVCMCVCVCLGVCVCVCVCWWGRGMRGAEASPACLAEASQLLSPRCRRWTWSARPPATPLPQAWPTNPFLWATKGLWEKQTNLLLWIYLCKVLCCTSADIREQKLLKGALRSFGEEEEDPRWWIFFFFSCANKPNKQTRFVFVTE